MNNKFGCQVSYSDIINYFINRKAHFFLEISQVNGAFAYNYIHEHSFKILLFSFKFMNIFDHLFII